MTVKEYLEQATRLDERILFEKQECQRLRELAQGLKSPSLQGRVDGSQSIEAPFVERLEKLAAEEKRLQEYINKMVDLKLQINAVLWQVKDPEKRTVLRMRYLQGKGMNEIAVKLHSCQRTIIRWAREGEAEIRLPPDAIDLGAPDVVPCLAGTCLAGD